ncbi:MAG: hypothetical protein IJX88_00165 [Clostridia bacterium]|nr:hypothetical protein [Clostridia bacterium]
MSEFEYVPFHIYSEDDYKPLPCAVFIRSVMEKVQWKRFPDRIEITVPAVFFSGGTEPFTITFKPVGETSAEYSDGGKAIAELEKRVGDIAPYQKWLKEFAEREGRIHFVGGRILTMKVWALSSGYAVESGIFDMLAYASIVANLDMYPLTYEEALYARRADV